MKKKWLVIFMMLVMSTMLFAGCGKKEETAAEPTPTVTSQADPTQTEDPGDTVTPIAAESIPQDQEYENANLLTGQDTLSPFAVGKRPVACMIDNVTGALPQSGLSQADVLFEIPVEGDLTRLMAIYGDITAVPQVCPVRSCRYYYPILAVGFDAFYVHWGMDDTIARDTLNTIEIDHLDGMDNDYQVFGRDQNRINNGVSREHTAYFNGTDFAGAVSDRRIELKAEKKGSAFSFVPISAGSVKPAGNACNTAVMSFGASSTTMTYDAASNTYLMSHNSTPQTDADTGAQAGFTNVIILETEISVRDDVGRKNVDWKGGPNSVGYYISNGSVQQIHWSKADEYAYLTFTDQNGQALQINRGKTYIAMNYAGRTTMN